MKRTILIFGFAIVLFSAQACLEDFFSSEEDEELNQGLIGVWYRYTMTEDGVKYGFPALLKMQEGGAGSIESIDSTDQEDPDYNTFIWTTNGGAITITDENDSTVWSGSFTLSENDNIVTFIYSQDGRSVEEVYVKYSGEKDAAMVGTWILVDTRIGTEEPINIERVAFNQDGSAMDYWIEDLEESTDVEHTAMTWNSNSNYLAVFSGDNTMPMVVRYSIVDDVFTGTDYNNSGEMEVFTFVKDAGNIDPDAVGTWILTSAKIGGYENPITGLEITLDLKDDNTGVWTVTIPLAGTDSSIFNWKTNSGYVFIYDEETPLIAWVQEYTISDNTLYLKTETDYYEVYGWVTSEYTFTRSQ